MKSAFKGVIPLLFLLLIPFVLAFSSYNIGEDSYLNGNGIWNFFYPETADKSELAFTDLTIAYPNIPVWDDIDGDGNLEAFIMTDDSFINAIDMNTFYVPDSYNFNGSGYSNIELYDIDGDSTKEIIFVANNTAYIMDYSNNTLSLNKTLNISSISTNSYSGHVKCSYDGCFVALSNDDYYFGSFTYDKVLEAVYSETAGQSSDKQINPIAMGDIDIDGLMDFIYYNVYYNTNHKTYLSRFEMSSNGNLTQVFENQQYSMTDSSASTASSSVVSAPLLLDVTGDSKLEIIYAYLVNYNSETWKMIITSVTGTELSKAPKVGGVEFTADGKYLSNMFKSDIDNDGEYEACVFGFSDSNKTSSMVCVSDDNYGVLNVGEEYNFNTPYDFDFISNRMIGYFSHSVNINGGGATEVMAPYGIYSLQGSDLYLEKKFYPNDDELSYSDFEFNNFYFPIDYQNTGYFDVLGLDSENNGLYLYDDTLENGNCVDNECLAYIQICPNINEFPGLTNTTLRVKFNLSDNENDALNYTFTIYDGTDNEQSYSGQTASNSMVTILSGTSSGLYLNQSIVSGLMTLSYFDAENPTKTALDVYDMYVSDTGRAYSSSTCYSTTNDITPTGTAGEFDEELNQTAVEEMVQEVSDLTNIGTTGIWLILMALAPIVLVYMILNSGAGITPAVWVSGVVILSVTEMFLLFTGFYFGFISVAWLWLIVLIGILILGGFVYKLLKGV
jgi:hypothetical protein